jgi:hypothetical protein
MPVRPVPPERADRTLTAVSALKQFFEHVPELLAGPAARFSFFHGLGATSACPPTPPLAPC